MGKHEKPGRVTESVNEFCYAVGIGRTRFYLDLRSGNIKAVKVGRKRLVPITEREAYLRRMSGQDHNPSIAETHPGEEQ